MNKQKQRIKFCQNCKNSGHSTQNCFRKMNPNPQNKIRSSDQRIVLNSTSIKFCNYCKNKGHDISECRKRMFANQNKNNNFKKNSQNSQLSHTNSTKPSTQGNIQTLDAPAAVPRELNHFAATNID